MKTKSTDLVSDLYGRAGKIFLLVSVPGFSLFLFRLYLRSIKMVKTTAFGRKTVSTFSAIQKTRSTVSIREKW